MHDAAPTSPPKTHVQLVHLARDIKLTHTVFALPFAVLGAFLAAGWAGRLPSWIEFLLIVLCMVAARTAAMSVNRWADAAIDARNPRTQNRAVPAGRVSSSTMLGTSIVSGLFFALMAGGFLLVRDNPWPLMLSPLVLAVLCGYSFTKRITWLCHIVLGLALALSPLAAAIAIEPGYLGHPTVWLLAAMVLCWVAGFDVIYALQDVETDREEALHSMPSRLGVGRALWISRGLHAIAAAALLFIVRVSPQLGLVFALAVGLTIALLVVEHALVWSSKQNRLHLAFFTVNGIISLLLGAGGLVDVIRLAP